MKDVVEIRSYDLMDIQACQRNRYPLLFIDRIIEAVPGNYAKAIKNFTYNEWFFPAHFDDEPNVPGFIQIEVLVQTFLMTFLTLEEYQGKKTAFLNINNVKMRKKIVPGDQMFINATLDSFKRGMAKGHVESSINGEPATSAEFVVGIPDVMAAFFPPRG